MKNNFQNWRSCPHAVGFKGKKAFSPGLIPDGHKEFQIYGCSQPDLVKKGTYPVENVALIEGFGDIAPRDVAIFYHQLNNSKEKDSNKHGPRGCAHCGFHPEFKKPANVTA